MSSPCELNGLGELTICYSETTEKRVNVKKACYMKQQSHSSESACCFDFICHSWRDFFSAVAESWKKLKTSNVVSSFIVCSIRNRSTLVRDLLICLSLFVSHGCSKLNHMRAVEDKSLALRACDLNFFTADLQTVNYYLTNHCQS